MELRLEVVLLRGLSGYYCLPSFLPNFDILDGITSRDFSGKAE